MTEKIETVIFSANHYFRTSLITIFENLSKISLVNILSIQDFVCISPSEIQAQLLVLILQSEEFESYLPSLNQVLSQNLQQKVLFLGLEQPKEYLSKNVIFHPNLTQLSKQTIETYLDRLFGLCPNSKNNERE